MSAADTLLDATSNVKRAVAHLISEGGRQTGKTVPFLKREFHLSAAGACTAIGIASAWRLERAEAGARLKREADEHDRLRRRHAAAEGVFRDREGTE